MPEAEYVWLPREDVLRFEEISRLVDVFLSLGVDKVRLTGGEPLLRRNVTELVRLLAVKPGVTDLAMTTNGVLLAPVAEDLKAAGLGRITVSLDTLDPVAFARLTRFDQHGLVLDGIDAAARVFGSIKIDTVVMRGVNDTELAALVDFGRTHGAEVRFIEYMDVGGATHWRPDAVVSRDEMLDRLSRAFGPCEPIPEDSSAPARRYRLRDGTTFGIIASTTAPFCEDCDRSRLTADGMFYLCLYATRGLDLRAPLRAGASDADLRELIRGAWTARVDRGAEARLALPDRTHFIPVRALRQDAHLEMHTKGG